MCRRSSDIYVYISWGQRVWLKVHRPVSRNVKNRSIPNNGKKSQLFG